MDIYYYHREKNGSEYAAVYSSWEEAEKEAATFLEARGYPTNTGPLDPPLSAIWMYIGKNILEVPPQYLDEAETALQKAEVNGYHALVELIKKNIELENE